ERSSVGTFLVLALKILLTPNPPDQLDIKIPAAPASSRALGKENRSSPVLARRSAQALVAASFSAFIFSKDSGVAYSFQLYSGRPVGWCMEIITNLPLTWGSQA